MPPPPRSPAPPSGSGSATADPLNGQAVTKALFRQMLAEEQEVVRGEVGEPAGNRAVSPKANALMDEITCADTLIDFLTLPGYERL